MLMAGLFTPAVPVLNGSTAPCDLHSTLQTLRSITLGVARSLDLPLLLSPSSTSHFFVSARRSLLLHMHALKLSTLSAIKLHIIIVRYVLCVHDTLGPRSQSTPTCRVIARCVHTRASFPVHSNVVYISKVLA